MIRRIFTGAHGAFWGALAATLFTAVLSWGAALPEKTILAQPVNIYGSQGVPIKTDDAGVVYATCTGATLTATGVTVVGQDGGYPVAVTGSVAATVIGTASTHDKGFSFTTAQTTKIVCSPGGDGGTLVLTAGQTYDLQVTTDSPVGLTNCGGCTSYASSDFIRNEGSEISFTPLECPDGGVPTFRCCSLGGTPIVSATPIQ